MSLVEALVLKIFQGLLFVSFMFFILHFFKPYYLYFLFVFLYFLYLFIVLFIFVY